MIFFSHLLLPPYKHITNQTTMFGRNFQTSVPRTRTLILQNRQFSVSSISNEENGNNNDDKPSFLPIPHNLPRNSLTRKLRNRSPENSCRHFFTPTRSPHNLFATGRAPRDCLCRRSRT
ncbi:hypothetical protein HOY80DRAFT_981259 [Tuber brumale]|nr:hypothetical protein HOY80DRAFT_981259 [Tuber brumale]